MEIKVNYTLVGAFVISLFSFIVFAIIWLSSGFSSGHYNIYKVYMKESVAGLSVDSTVEFNGVGIGTVKSIEIDPNDPHLVILLLNVKTTTPISDGTRATLNTKGLTGIAYIALIDQGLDLTPLHTKPGEQYPVIETAPSLFWRLDTGMHKLNENFTRISQAIEGLLDDENLHSIKEILIDLRHVTRTLATNTDQIDLILHNTARASEQFSPFIQASQNTMKLLNAQLLPAARQALTNLDVITNNLADLAIDLKENPAMLIRGKTPPPLGPGEK